MNKKLVLVCLFNFLIAAFMGLAMRFSFISNINVNYRFLMHAHSHVAMLGWVYLILYVFIVHYFVPEKKPIYNKLFWLTQFSVIGMMLSFPFQGYAVISISFSTLHIFCSYYFAYLIWKHHKTKTVVTSRLLKTSLLFMLLSTVGVWCLGPAVSMLGQASAFYQIAIQFFLHFQFTGWFLIAVIAVFFHVLKIEDSKRFQLFFKLLLVSVCLSLALPIYWFIPNQILFFINGLGVLVQLLAFIVFLKLVKPQFKLIFKSENRMITYCFQFSMFCFALKVGLQLLSLIPKFSMVAYQHHSFVIGFIHLTMLGVITGFLFSFLIQSELVINNKILKLSVVSFVSGFIITELLIIIQGARFYFGQGILANYYLILFLSSILLPLGIILIIINILKTKNT